jgi:preprotein translocase subunit SecY
MLRAFINAFKIPDLRRKLLFTLGMIGVYRVGWLDPAPGIDVELLRDAVGTGVRNWRHRGHHQRVRGRRPRSRWPSSRSGSCPTSRPASSCSCSRWSSLELEELQKRGRTGPASKITQYTRYLTVALALLQSTT